MVRRIAFTSCMDTVNYPVQPGWRHLAGHRFDTLVLLGDSIYMDYGRWPGHHNRPKEEDNGTPKFLPSNQFSARMHQRYKAQFELPEFQDVIQLDGLREIYAIWDDHDFAWNNSRGAGPDTRDELVSPAIRRLARQQFGVWLEALQARRSSYPPNPAPDGWVAESDDGGTIATSVRLEGSPAMLHLTDGRTFREQRHGSLLGTDQRNTLTERFNQDAVHIVASGSDLDAWSAYTDLAWLEDQSRRARILVLSGDIHRPRFHDQEVGRIYEVTASAMAQGPAWVLKRDEVFGLIEIDEQVIDVQLFVGADRFRHERIDIGDWALI